MSTFKIPEIPPTANKTIRFPIDIIEGVEKAKVSFEEEEAVITYDNEKVSEKQIIIEIEEAGFKAEK